jgi:tight adherence protein C
LIIFLILAFVTMLLGLTMAALLLVRNDEPLSDRLMKAAGPQLEVTEPSQHWLKRLTQAISKGAGPLRQSLGFSASPDVAKKLALAGYKQTEAVELFYAVKMFSPVAAALAAGFIIREDVFFWFVALSIVGIVGTDFWLTSAIERHRNQIRISLPDALDLLVVCMEAGLGMDQALLHVGNELKASHPVIADEFMTINLEQRTGKPRIEAWKGMAERTQIEIVQQFVSMLVQTEKFGTPLSRSLSTFADTVRTKRRQAAEQMAAKTTVKLIFPLVLFIFPSMLIVLLAPAVISISRNLGKFFQ